MTRRLQRLALLVATALAGCGTASTSGNAGAPSSDSIALRGPLTVLAAASLRDAFTAGRTQLQHDHPGLDVSTDFAGSQILVQQLEAGAPGDVIATADQATMDRLRRDGIADAPRIFARNRLQIAVAPGNPRGIHGLADLARDDLTVILADPSVPAGHYAQQALQHAGVTVQPRSLELDVTSVLRKVASGEADAGIVYATDVRSGGVGGVDIPDADNVIAVYPIAVVHSSAHRAAAAAYLDDVLSGATHRALLARGFLPP